MNTKEFSEEERKNRRIDFVGGFEIMDNEMRLLIVEGLGGRGHGMHILFQNTFLKVLKMGLQSRYLLAKQAERQENKVPFQPAGALQEQNVPGF